MRKIEKRKLTARQLKRLGKVPDLAKRLKLSVGHIYNLRSDNELPDDLFYLPTRGAVRVFMNKVEQRILDGKSLSQAEGESGNPRQDALKLPSGTSCHAALRDRSRVPTHVLLVRLDPISWRSPCVPVLVASHRGRHDGATRLLGRP